jgi:endoglucanase
MRRIFAGFLVLCSLVMIVPPDAQAAVESASNAVVFAGQGGSITDQSLNTWTIVNGVVKKNGSSAGYSAGVIKLAYVNHVVWQQNASYRWWNWNGSSWSGGYSGTSVSPLIESVNNFVYLPGQSAVVVDAQKNAWTIVNGVVKKNGVNAGYSANVLKLAYVNHVVWQMNANNLWWSWNGSSWSGGAGTSVSPLPVPVAVASPSNPFTGTTLYVNDWTNALNQANLWRTSRPADAADMDMLADQPTAVWFGDWNADITADVDDYVDEAVALNDLPVLVAYNIPNRDCGDGYSAGGVDDAADYHDWIVDFANGIGTRSAVVILEPDAVALDCFDDARGAMLSDAVNVLEAKPGVSVYIDAGHPNWTIASTMATRLNKSGIAKAQGFALNVSNFYTTDSNIDFGDELSALVGGKHYVIDTSRNANGWQGEWCNPQGAGIGELPDTSTGVALLDALLWVKAPGDSDGNCHGGPNAGYWWGEYALDLVANAD